MRAKNIVYEEEIMKLRMQVQMLTKNSENFLSLVQKAKKKAKASKQSEIDLNEIKESYDIMSKLESYSILEKINEWKRDEGLSSMEDMQETHIPRPVKLITDISLEDL